MSDWQTLRLDEVADRVSTKNAAGHLRVMTVAAGRGLIDQENYFTKRVASADLSTYLALEPGDFVYNKSSSKDAPWGVVARNDSGTPAVVTPLYIAFRPRVDLVDPDFLLLACNGSTFFDSLRGRLREGARAHGLLNVRLPEFFAAQVSVPPLAEQRRIVDLVAAVDAQLAHLRDEVSALQRVLAARRAALFERRDVPGVQVRDAFSVLMGRQRAPQHARGPHMTNYLRSANVNKGSLDLTDVKQMNFTPAEQEKFALRRGDVLVSEGSASPTAVGYTAVWNEELPGVVCFQKTLLRFRGVDGISTAAYTHHWCQWAFESGTFLRIASGTNIKHITAARVMNVPVSLPSIEDQAKISSELDALGTHVMAAHEEVRKLQILRAALLSDLLRQVIRVPPAYDRLLAEVG